MGAPTQIFGTHRGTVLAQALSPTDPEETCVTMDASVTLGWFGAS